jgi:two-component system, LytTR family, response regulator
MDANVPIKTLIVDDELHACRNLDKILKEFLSGQFSVCGFAHNLADAEKAIALLQPTLVFLDIEMNEGNTFQLLERISPVNFEIIFVTAYEEYALKALKLNVADYLLKPIDIPELKIAAKKVQDRLSISSTAQQAIEKPLNAGTMILKDNHNNYVVVALKDFLYVEALKSYSKVIYLRDHQRKELVMSKSLSEFENLLPVEMFIRIHRSFLVNREHIKIIHSEKQQIILRDQEINLPISRRRFSEVLLLLKGQKK